MTTIVDYGVGNVASIVNMLKRVGETATVSSAPDVLRAAKRLILPGVGAFDTGMQNLRARGLVDVLDEVVRGRGTPILGICLGMQLFARRSDEGTEPGLGWLDADCTRFDFSTAERQLKVPHMGWNEVEVGAHQSGIVPHEARFYFVHAYFVRCRDEMDVAGTSTYGHRFTAAVQRGNIYGVQFHPEKSHRFGMALLGRFLERT